MQGAGDVRVESPTVRPSLREPLLVFLGAISLSSALYWTGRAVPFVHQNLHLGIAAIFFYAPALAAYLFSRPRTRFDFRAAGLRLDPLPLNAAVLGIAVAVTFPLFIFAFFQFYDVACSDASTVLARLFHRACPGSGWVGFAGARIKWPPDFLLLAANQIVVIALPEEMFFRGYLLDRLEARWPSRRRLWGAPVGAALLASSALFAAGHVLVDFNPQRLAVFFPALVFGWMRARTGSVAAGTAFHALCNLLSDVLHASYF
jgi:membrane protease YdiL (CAAX protease family)